jgi:cytochrome c oxidase subunit II
MTPEPRPATRIYLYELAWILPSIAIPVGMLVALTVTAFEAGIHLLGRGDASIPARSSRRGPSTSPGWCRSGQGGTRRGRRRRSGPSLPGRSGVPAGLRTRFIATSKDVVHGLYIPAADINAMLLPGQITNVEARFDQPGEYPVSPGYRVW